jgi:hypothetical protein
VGLNGTQRDERLARTALCYYRSCPGLLPASNEAHDSECLGRIGFPKELANYGGRCVVDGMQRWVGLKDSTPNSWAWARKYVGMSVIGSMVVQGASCEVWVR